MKRVNHLSWMRGAVVLTVTAIAAMTSTIALADDGTISYMAEEGAVETIAESEAVDITDAGGKIKLENGKTYVICGDKTFADGVEVKGDVTLILRNGVTATVKKGLCCSKGNSIRICSESASSSKLVSVSDSSAGIGGGASEDCGKVVICGGTVEAECRVDGAGIGGGRFKGDGGDVYIYDAVVTAKGYQGAAGIGGSVAGEAGDVTIVRSNVTAEGREGEVSGDGGAGIGGGCANGFTDAGDGGRVHIVDSTVKAVGSGDAAGIGGGGDHWFDSGDQGDGGDVIIEGDSVVEAESGGAGSAIGRGDDEGDPGEITLGDSLKVTTPDSAITMLLGKGAAPASSREWCCQYKGHVKIEPCSHDETTYEISETAHKLTCVHCYGLPEEVYHHEYDEDGTCQDCGFHADEPYFGETTLGSVSPDYVTFWVNINGLDEDVYKASYIDITLEEPGKAPIGRRDYLSQYGERRGCYRGYSTWVIDDKLEDATLRAVVHYGDGKTIETIATLADCRKAAAELGQ